MNEIKTERVKFEKTKKQTKWIKDVKSLKRKGKKNQKKQTKKLEADSAKYLKYYSNANYSYANAMQNLAPVPDKKGEVPEVRDQLQTRRFRQFRSSVGLFTLQTFCMHKNAT